MFRLRNSACRIKLLITYLPMVQGHAKEDNTSSSFGCSLSDRIGHKSLYTPSSGADEYWYWREVRMLEQ